MTAAALELPLHDPFDLPAYMAQRIIVNDAGCWIWQVSIDNHGYGRASMSFPHTARRRWSSHRLAYLLLVGPIPAGLHLDHLCRVRACCNPTHLEPVTPLENVHRSTSADHWRSKTHCPRDHAYDVANTGHDSKGRRYCRTCARDRMRATRPSRSARRTLSAPTGKRRTA